jgi:hypothetical protein
MASRVVVFVSADRLVDLLAVARELFRELLGERRDGCGHREGLTRTR